MRMSMRKSKTPDRLSFHGFKRSTAVYGKKRAADAVT